MTQLQAWLDDPIVKDDSYIRFVHVDTVRKAFYPLALLSFTAVEGKFDDQWRKIPSDGGEWSVGVDLNGHLLGVAHSVEPSREHAMARIETLIPIMVDRTKAALEAIRKPLP